MGVKEMKATLLNRSSVILNVVMLLLIAGIGLKHLHNAQSAPAPLPDRRLNFKMENHLRQSYAFTLMPPRHCQVVFVGDSLTAGTDWEEWLPGQNVLNRGLAGDMTQGIADRLPEIIRHRPSVIVLQGGINDIARGDTPEQVVASFEQIIQNIHRQLPQTRLVLQSLYPIDPGMAKEHGINLSPNVNARIQQTNDLLRQQAGIAWVDVNSHLENAHHLLDRRYAMDGIHINGDGYKVVVETLRPVVLKALNHS
jgi:lysophospholipase L1-like esterase